MRHFQLKHIMTWALAAMLLFARVPPGAHAAVWTVDSTEDQDDATPGDGLCADALGRCTLRAAVATANDGDDIVLPAGQFLLDSPLDIDRAITITGAGPDQTSLFTGRLFVDQETLVRVLGGSPTIRAIALSHARGVGHAIGGRDGSLTLQDCVVSDTEGTGISMVSGSLLVERCVVTRTPGPGIRATNSDVTVRDSSIIDNGCCAPFSPGVGLSVFSNTIPYRLVIERSEISRNRGLDGSGGIHVTGMITEIFDSLIIGNGGAGPGSGGIFAIGELSVTRSIVADNASSTAAAGIHIGGGNARIVDSTIARNRGLATFGPRDLGGGVGAQFADVVLVNTTLSGNSVADSQGGAAIRARDNSDVLLLSCTVVPSRQSLPGSSQLFPDSSSQLRLGNTVVAGTGGLSGAIEALGWNLIEDPHDAVLLGEVATVRTGIDPMLTMLGDFGGGILTHLPRPSSPVLDAGDPLGCFDEAGNPLAFDARSEVRVQDATGAGAPRCDIGAVELSSSDPRVPPPLLLARKAGSAVHLTITSAAEEAVTGHDIARGLLEDLWITRVADAPCVATGVIGGEWLDVAASDSPALYYLARGVNATDRSDWGADSFGRPRPACP